MEQLSIQAPELGSAVQRSRRRANILLSLLVVCGLLEAPAIGSSALNLHLQRRATGGVPISEQEAAVTELIAGVVALAYLPVLLATGVVWLLWLHASYGNLRLIGDREARFSTGWAVGSWFVPFLNLVRPFQVIKDLWWRSALENRGGFSDYAPAPGTVVGWWTLTLVGNFVGRAAVKMMLAAEPIVSPATMSMTMLASDVLDLTQTVLAFVVVRAIRDHQERWPLDAVPATSAVAAL